jgi:DNA-binding phage protein
MRIVVVLIIIFFTGPVHTKAQQYFDFALQKVDRADGIADSFITLPDSASGHWATYAFLKLPDSIRNFVQTSNLNPALKSGITLNIYNDLMGLAKHQLAQPQPFIAKYEFLLTWIEKELDHNTFSFMLKNTEKTFSILPYISHSSSVEKFIKLMAETNPDKVIENFQSFSKTGYALKVIEKAAIADPIVAKRYFTGRNELYNTLQKSENDTIKTILEIHQKLGKNTRTYLFTHDILHKNLSIDSAHLIASACEKTYLMHLLKIRSEKSTAAAFSIDNELGYLALRFVRILNDEHENYDETSRFKSISNLSAAQLYTLMVYSEEEIFTSSFNGTFRLFLKALEKEKLSGFELLEKTGFNRFRIFLKMCAGYDRLEAFLKTFSAQEKEILFSKFIRDIHTSGNPLAEAVAVADAIGSIGNVEILQIIENELLSAYEEANQHLIYGLLIHLFSPKASINKSKTDSIAALFPIENIDYLSNLSLLGSEKINTQVHFFYDDDDGHASFHSFIQHFKQPGWVIVDFPQYVLIASVKGQRVKIYANKPTFERTAHAIIADSLQARNLSADIVVHRGHSFYVHQTLNEINEQTHLVLMGSCGGYHKLTEILDRAPAAHIISTKQIGSMHVNNPMIFAFSEKIRKGEDLVWENFWKEMEIKLKENSYAHKKFKEYVGPHQNMGARFIQAYRNYL